MVTETGVFAARVDISKSSLIRSYIDANAPLDELQAFAEQRVRSVAQVLDSLSLVSGESLEGRDLAYIAQLAAQVLEEGCEVMAVMQQRLAQQAT